MKLFLLRQFKTSPAFAGQTMIETLVAIFMLTMGVSAALGLAIFAFSSSTNIAKQIVATGLAREGLEAVKNMRDTNWLQQTAIDKNCWNYVAVPPDLTGLCYQSWLGTGIGGSIPYCLDPTNNNGVGNCQGDGTFQDFNLGFDSSQSGTGYWNFKRQWNSTDFGLVFDASASLAAGKGFYYAVAGQACNNAAGMSDYCRKITITKVGISPVAVAPYNQATEGPLLKVQSFVWWVDKKCPRVADWPQASSSCRLELDMYLTNWKNY